MSKLARKPPQPPTPKITRPLAKPNDNKARPLTRKLMAALGDMIDDSDGKLTRHQLATDIGRHSTEVVEWIGCYRSFPNCESTLKMLSWAMKRNRSFAKNLLS